ncbi:uncharacterized protein LOC141640527 [Silene latifolia]|uniref:uncharacterized protein LOC141640527 n=1 Tax=Silene latifolia TaxID=37657 RepID=UPI003D76C5AF
MDKQEAEDDAQVVMGTFLINNKLTYLLFDSGATHSFVSKSHATTMGLGEFALVDFPVDLFEFPLYGFEVIVKMDWLSKYKASIDFQKKKVSLRGPKGIRVFY